MGNWKTESQLLDYEHEPNRIIGFLCRNIHCRSYQGFKVSELLETFDKQDRLDQIERQIRCLYWYCNCPVHIEVNHGHLNEQFQGGLP